MRKGAETRERILEIAEASVLAKGFGATSIEEVIAEAGITKSGFFYHFKDKNELARALM
ncbi:MAG: helix-turn-helix transcriptional regulator, partial [Mesorhizobium sp.]